MAKMFFHCCLDVRGGIRNAKDLKGCITVDGHTLFTVKEVKSFLQDHLNAGHEVLPIGDCDNFDYKTGCRGHYVEDGAE